MADNNMNNSFVSSITLNNASSLVNTFESNSKTIIQRFYSVMNEAVMKMGGTGDGKLLLPNGITIDLKTTAGVGTFNMWVQSQTPIIDMANNALGYVIKTEKSLWGTVSG
ncbi:MAG: hypothetical protein WC860_09125 [Candidatus Margulisiibacteriota bacterium]|jgi:hypothetical protein